MKRLMVLVLTNVAVLLTATIAIGQTDVASLRAQFREIARLQEMIRPLPKLDVANQQEKELIRQENEAKRALLKVPVERILAAFDQSIAAGDKAEIVGALAGYQFLILENVTQPDPRYKSCS